MTERNNKEMGIYYHKLTWEFINRVDRTKEQDMVMIDMAHASSLHWFLSSAFEPIDAARCQWLISRVYSILKMGESALYHAQNSLDVCLNNHIKDYDLAYAYEALARALMVQNDIDQSKAFVQKAMDASKDIASEKEKERLISELATIKDK